MSDALSHMQPACYPSHAACAVHSVAEHSACASNPLPWPACDCWPQETSFPDDPRRWITQDPNTTTYGPTWVPFNVSEFRPSVDYEYYNASWGGVWVWGGGRWGGQAHCLGSGMKDRGGRMLGGGGESAR